MWVKMTSYRIVTKSCSHSLGETPTESTGLSSESAAENLSHGLSLEVTMPEVKSFLFSWWGGKCHLRNIKLCHLIFHHEVLTLLRRWEMLCNLPFPTTSYLLSCHHQPCCAWALLILLLWECDCLVSWCTAPATALFAWDPWEREKPK